MESCFYLRFCTSPGEFAKAFFCGHGKDLEDNLSQFTLTQIMRTFPLLPSSFPPLTSMPTTRIPVESSQLPTPSPWNGHYGIASYVYLVCVDLLGSLYIYHSVDQNGTQRGVRSFCASISCLALWHWWLKLGSGLSLWIQDWNVCCLKTPQCHCAPGTFIVFIPSLGTFCLIRGHYKPNTSFTKKPWVYVWKHLNHGLQVNRARAMSKNNDLVKCREESKRWNHYQRPILVNKIEMYRTHN